MPPSAAQTPGKNHRPRKKPRRSDPTSSPPSLSDGRLPQKAFQAQSLSRAKTPYPGSCNVVPGRCYRAVLTQCGPILTQCGPECPDVLSQSGPGEPMFLVPAIYVLGPLHVGVALAKCPVIDAQDRRGWANRQGRRPDQPQQRVARDRDAEVPAEPGAR